LKHHNRIVMDTLAATSCQAGLLAILATAGFFDYFMHIYCCTKYCYSWI